MSRRHLAGLGFAAASLIMAMAASNVEAITVRVNCGATRSFSSFTSPKELVFLVRNLGNCTAQFTAYDQDDLGGSVLVSFTLGPNQAVSVNKPSPPNSLARSISIVASGVEADGRAILDFAALPPDSDSNWGRNGDAVYNLNLGNVGIGTSEPASLLHVFDGVAKVQCPPLPLGSVDARLVLRNENSVPVESYLVSSNRGDFRINVGGVDVVTMESDGSVGIGTEEPTAQLDVVGDAVVSGKVAIGGASGPDQVTVAGVVSSTQGGFRFPDGTIQTTAASSTSTQFVDVQLAALGPAPLDFQVIDLSGIVGGRRAMVLVSIVGRTNAPRSVAFRPRGHTRIQRPVVGDASLNVINVNAAGSTGTAWVSTNVDGMIEWVASEPMNVELYLEAYQ